MIKHDKKVIYGWGNETSNTPEEHNDIPSMRPKKTGNHSLLRDVLFFVFDVGLNAIIIVGLVFLLRVYVVTPFRVYGPSMCDTLNFMNNRCVRDNGEYIIVNKIIYRNIGSVSFDKPERGDIIVFRPPNGKDEYYIKRVIGLPFETVKISEGSVFILNKENPEGYELSEPYLNKTNAGNTVVNRRNGTTEFTVPENSYLVLGDNRIMSNDSRHCFNDFGCTGDSTSFVPFNNIAGKAWVSLWPFQTMRFL
ncbi:signal peptidase I [Candidatus Peregrinibacteria bacterium]|nr:signal peptidase I [Candidatus Peregrinibacteria bacterium]